MVALNVPITGLRPQCLSTPVTHLLVISIYLLGLPTGVGAINSCRYAHLLMTSYTVHAKQRMALEGVPLTQLLIAISMTHVYQVGEGGGGGGAGRKEGGRDGNLIFTDLE